MSDLVTLIIILHGRHQNLDRLLEYYQGAPFLIIIADSSKERHEFKTTNRSYKYFYTPGITYTQKIELALGQTITPYVIMCADDDFIVPGGIVTCVDFLEKNEDYAIAQGVCISFIKNSILGKNVDFRALYENRVFDIEMEDPLTRLENVFAPYRSVLYAVHRTQNLSLAFSGASTTINNLFFNEYLTAIIPIALGKYKELSVLFSVREYAEDSDDKTAINLDNIVFEKRHQSEYDAFLNHQSQIIARVLNIDFNFFKKELDKILKRYAENLKLGKLKVTDSPEKKIGKIIANFPFFGKTAIKMYRIYIYKKSILYAIKTKDDNVALNKIRQTLINSACDANH